MSGDPSGHRPRHRLADLLLDAAAGRFPRPDGVIEIVAAPEGRADAVVAFTAHSVVATALDPVEVRGHVPAGDLGAAMDPRFLAWLAGRLKVEPGALDVVLVIDPRTDGLGTNRGDDTAPMALERRTDLFDHPRVARALAYRDDVRVYADPRQRGIAIIGRGLAGRWEVSVEVEEPGLEPGLGTRLIRAAIREAAPDEPLFAQVSPGNARSLRAFLDAGFRPIGSEMLFLVR